VFLVYTATAAWMLLCFVIVRVLLAHLCFCLLFCSLFAVVFPIRFIYDIKNKSLIFAWFFKGRWKNDKSSGCAATRENSRIFLWARRAPLSTRIWRPIFRRSYLQSWR